MKGIRIDQLLVKKGLVESRESAQKLILARKVMIGAQYADKPSRLVHEDAEVRVLESLKYVSRGGLKLEKALDAFHISVADRVVLDVGASTGGFTDCLLQRNAKRVYAVDVGYGQLAWKLRQDPRVVVFERTNARFLTRNMFPDPIDLAVVDVSFIGSEKILDPLRDITDEVVLLLKPQFEAGPDEVPKGGVIRNPEVHCRILQNFYLQLESRQVHGLIESPVLGSSGNREFLVHLKIGAEEGLNEERYMQKVKELLQ